jgi:hypothetical protein
MEDFATMSNFLTVTVAYTNPAKFSVQKIRNTSDLGRGVR